VGEEMKKAQVHVLPASRNTIMVVDDQSTGRAIVEQVVRSLDERVTVGASPARSTPWCGRRATSPISSWWIT